MERRESIWSVWRDHRDLYSGIFVVLVFAGVGLIVANGIQQEGPWLQRSLVAIQYLAAVVIGAAGLAVALIEIWRVVVVLAKSLEGWIERRREKQRAEDLAKGRAEGRAEGREEGLSEGRAEERAESAERWKAWLERREVARQANEEFDEPMPI